MDWQRSVGSRIYMRPRGPLGWLGGLVMARVNRSFNRWVVELADAAPTARILEIGFGPGVAIGLLADAAPQGHVSGIDHSAEMLRQASARNAEAIRQGDVDLRVARAEDLPFGDETFDVVVATASMHLLPEPLAGLREAWRVLRPGGRLVLGFYTATGQQPDAVVNNAQAAGFRDSQIAESKEGFCILAARPAPA